MLEGNPYIEQYRPLSPQQKNQELKGVYKNLPDFSIFHDSEDAYKTDPLTGKVVYTKPLKECMEGIVEVEEHRKNSRFTQILRSRHAALLSFGHITPSCKTYLMDEFAELCEFGLERDPMSGWKGELDILGDILSWDSDSVSIFDSTSYSTNAEIDRRFYRRAVGLQLRGIQIDEMIENDQNLSDLQERIRKSQAEFEVLFEVMKKAMSEEELAKMQKSVEETKRVVEEYEKEKTERVILVKNWREEHMQMFDDEP